MNNLAENLNVNLNFSSFVFNFHFILVSSQKDRYFCMAFQLAAPFLTSAHFELILELVLPLKMACGKELCSCRLNTAFVQILHMLTHTYRVSRGPGVLQTQFYFFARFLNVLEEQWYVFNGRVPLLASIYSRSKLPVFIFRFGSPLFWLTFISIAINIFGAFGILNWSFEWNINEV